MMTRSLFLITAGVLALGLTPSATAADSSDRRIDVPQVPSNLEVPRGHEVFLEGQAVGTQNYICMPAATGVAWKFLGPQATLFLSKRGDFEQQIMTHFLSANPGESGLPRPTWQHSFDSSQVWGKVAQSSTDPNYVAPGAIPWLLVEIAGRSLGPTDGSQLVGTTYIQRLNTSGGVAPATGCSQAAEIGALALVPYTTDYFFYKVRRNR